MKEHHTIKATSREQLKSEVEKYKLMGWKPLGMASVVEKKASQNGHTFLYRQSMELECQHIRLFELDKLISSQQFLPSNPFRGLPEIAIVRGAKQQLFETIQNIKGEFNLYAMADLLCLINGWVSSQFLRSFLSKELSKLRKEGKIERVGGPRNGPFVYKRKLKDSNLVG